MVEQPPLKRLVRGSNPLQGTEMSPERTRPFDLDEYFMQIARTASSRSTCDRKHVGAVLVNNDDDELFSTGYNGSSSGRPHCDDVGHFIHEGHCVRIVHAE